MSVKGNESLNLKRITVVSLLLLFITANFATAELTKQDLDKSLAEQERRIKEYIDLKIEAVKAEIKAVNSKIDAVEKSVNARIDAVDSRINSVEKVVEQGQERLQWMIGILALVVVAGIAFPPIWQEWRERKASSLAQRVLRLEQEIENLKKARIVT